MTNPLAIILGDQPEKTLNKEQRRFNTLVNKISALRERIAETKELDLELRRLGDNHLKPVADKVKEAYRDWVFALHEHPAKSKLPKKMADKFALVMLDEIEALLHSYTYSDDTALQDLYAHYEGSGRSFEQIQEEIEQEEKILKAQMMRSMFGMDIEPEDLDNPEKMQEKIHAQEASFAKAAQERKEQQKRRKKSDLEMAAEEKRLTAQASVKKTTKQIYLDLVRHFHPDKEQDEQKRVEKTEIMKQITVAYEADDHLRLLELQMNLLAARNNAFADFDNLQLKYFNQTLQKQVQELEQELFFSSPEGNGNLYAPFFSPNRAQMLRNIELKVRDSKKSMKGVRHNLSIIHDDKVFLGYIRAYEVEDSWGW